MSDISDEQWEEGKRQHIALSNAAADDYEEMYANANFATKAYMDMEASIVKDVASLASDRKIALDLGSGTGRHSAILAKKFDQVFGYDNAPNMITKSSRVKLIYGIGNVAYQNLDVEVSSLPHKSASVGLVNSSFGMASFLKDPNDLLKEIRRVLKPQGWAIFSFYNSESYTNLLSLPWKPSLAAIPNTEKQCLDVTIPSGDVFHPGARMYSVKEVQKTLSQYFEIKKLMTYPSLSALMPQELFDSPLAGKLCNEVDKVLSENLDIAAGNYIVAICQKVGKLTQVKPKSGFQKSYDLLASVNLTGDIKRHTPVKTMQDAEAALNLYGVTPNQMLKSVLLAAKPENSVEHPNPLRPPSMWLVVTQSNRMVDFSKAAKIIGIERARLRLAKLSELEDYTGFTIGAIPPFAMPKNIPVIFDEKIKKLPFAWCGTGDSTQSIKISIPTLEQLATASYGNVSKARRKA